MSTSLNILGLAVALALAGCNQATPPADSAAANATDVAPPLAEPAMPAEEAATVPAPQLQATLRELWHGHIVHARDYALAMHAGNAQAVFHEGKWRFSIFCHRAEPAETFSPTGWKT